MESHPDHCTVEHHLVKPSQIHYLRFILEAYEGAATVTTRDSLLGWVQINIAPGFEREAREVLAAEQERLGLRHLAVQDSGEGDGLGVKPGQPLASRCNSKAARAEGEAAGRDG